MKPRTVLFLGILVTLTTLLGWGNTPRRTDGTPLLLLPGTRAVQNYRRQAQDWVKIFQEIDGQLAVLFSSTSRDLMQVSREAEKTNRALLHLYQEIDQKTPPEPLQSLQEQLLETVLAYLKADSLGLTWISSGEEADLKEARSDLVEAHSLLKALSSSPWISGE